MIYGYICVNWSTDTQTAKWTSRQSDKLNSQTLCKYVGKGFKKIQLLLHNEKKKIKMMILPQSSVFNIWQQCFFREMEEITTSISLKYLKYFWGCI